MPLPHYIIGSESRSEDKLTGLFSHFGVVESVEITATQLDTELPPQFADQLAQKGCLWFTASWMRLEDEPIEQVYESQWVTHSPGLAEASVFHEHQFEISKRFVRFVVRVSLQPKSFVSGVRAIEHRIRPVGGDAPWQSQRFNFWVDRVAPSTENTEPN